MVIHHHCTFHILVHKGDDDACAHLFVSIHWICIELNEQWLAMVGVSVFVCRMLMMIHDVVPFFNLLYWCRKEVFLYSNLKCVFVIVILWYYCWSNLPIVCHVVVSWLLLLLSLYWTHFTIVIVKICETFVVNILNFKQASKRINNLLYDTLLWY